MSNKIRVNYLPENEQPPRKGGFGIDNVALVPGYNSIRESDLSLVDDNPNWKRRVKWGAIRVMGEVESDSKKSDNLLDLPVGDAIDIVTNTTERSKLETYLKAEQQKSGKNRTTVINAINRQIETVTKGKL